MLVGDCIIHSGVIDSSIGENLGHSIHVEGRGVSIVVSGEQHSDELHIWNNSAPLLDTSLHVANSVLSRLVSINVYLYSLMHETLLTLALNSNDI